MKFKTQAAAPLMQAGVFMAVLFTTAYAPQELLTGWLHTVAELNPVTQILEAVRQGFVGDVTWADTWPGLRLAGRTRSWSLIGARAAVAAPRRAPD